MSEPVTYTVHLVTDDMARNLCDDKPFKGTPYGRPHFDKLRLCEMCAKLARDYDGPSSSAATSPAPGP